MNDQQSAVTSEGGGAGTGQSTGPPQSSTPEPERKRRFSFPSALTVLAIVLLAVWAAAFFIPSGVYQVDEEGSPIPGSYQELPACDDVGEDVACVDKGPLDMFQILWTGTPNGLYGVENTSGEVQASNEGTLFGSAEIFLFVLAVGAFITVTMRTGAIEAGIKRLALGYRRSPTALIVILMGVFAVGGTTYGMWEETLGFYTLMAALVLAMSLDRLVGASVILVGAGTGVLTSTVNPFATGVASDAAGIPISDGIGLRLVMWLAFVAAGILYVLWYARRVAKDPSRSIVGRDDQGDVAAASDPRDVADVPKLTGRQRWVLLVFGLAFAIMIYGFIPWNDISQNMFGADFALPELWELFGDFYFTEASMLFIVAAVVIGVVGGLGEDGTVTAIVAGASDFLGAALVIVVARGITVVMKNAFITDTILNMMEEAVSGTSSVVFAIVAFVVNIPIAFLVPSSSGHAALVMPILAPLSDFAGVERSVAVTAYQSASGWVNLVTPTSAVLMGGLALAKVGYDKYLRFIAAYMGILFVAVVVFLAAAVVIS